MRLHPNILLVLTFVGFKRMHPELAYLFEAEIDTLKADSEEIQCS